MENLQRFRQDVRQVWRKTRMLFIVTIWLHLVTSLDAGYFISPWDYFFGIGVVATVIFVGLTLLEMGKKYKGKNVNE